MRICSRAGKTKRVYSKRRYPLIAKRENQHEMLELIRAQTQELGLITIAVLHDIHHALHYARDLIMLKKGRVLSCKASRDVCDADLEHLFEMRLSIHEIRGHKFVYFGHSHAGI